MHPVLRLLVAAAVLTPSYAYAAGSSSSPWTYLNQGWGNGCAADVPNQSPIALVGRPSLATSTATVSVASNGPLVLKRVVENLTYEYKSTAGSPAETVTVDGVPYQVYGFHVHSPAEHLVGGGTTLEVHIKARAADKSVAVFAILFGLDEDAGFDPLLSQILGANWSAINVLDVTPWLQKFESSPFFRYTGSLTTPPCTGGIKFFVTDAPIAIPPIQYYQYINLMADSLLPTFNARNQQPGTPSDLSVVNMPTD